MYRLITGKLFYQVTYLRSSGNCLSIKTQATTNWREQHLIVVYERYSIKWHMFMYVEPHWLQSAETADKLAAAAAAAAVTLLLVRLV